MTISLLLTVLWSATMVFGLIFGLSYWHDRTKLYNGILFNLFLFSFLATLASSILNSDNTLLIYGTGIPFVFIVFSLALLFVLQAFLLLWNAWIVWRRESHSLANSLTLYLGVFILVFPFIERLITPHLTSFWASWLSFFSSFITLYIVFWFYNYLTCLVLYQLYWPKHNKDFIVVLGAGLMNGDTVTPLLGQRIDRAITFWQRQLARKNRPATLILSGGQGGDETVPEGQAMRDYAIAHGIPADQAIAETQSKNTYENMFFSKRLIAESGVEHPKTIFVTNNYHTFRAAIFAKQAGLAASGIGARTAGFFLPNAVMREYIAIIVQHKRSHMAVAFAILVFTALLSVIQSNPDWVSNFFRFLDGI
ncbi:hypothetical protein GPK34_09920 [Secundilactobacillus kimchicus]|uniref:DUF218 domain-containing protein n=1 Tax=Secundilactobacillus kimchicus JCM 15530 TaxID=1302272 RepID=A0A0R1HLU1_9LACO|nr:YdcF family protein [Secundilactobacillus kimchicus]KRK47323.1 hypothetical protein FC96_GL000594 [Secundilactobacillus kimchicus JCM 15530]MBT9672350.1 hypothetical protein [Secundilactobacillus kimchicus]